MFANVLYFPLLSSPSIGQTLLISGSIIGNQFHMSAVSENPPSLLPLPLRISFEVLVGTSTVVSKGTFRVVVSFISKMPKIVYNMSPWYRKYRTVLIFKTFQKIFLSS
jgi:hypothetical protein